MCSKKVGTLHGMGGRRGAGGLLASQVWMEGIALEVMVNMPYPGGDADADAGSFQGEQPAFGGMVVLGHGLAEGLRGAQVPFAGDARAPIRLVPMM